MKNQELIPHGLIKACRKTPRHGFITPSRIGMRKKNQAAQKSRREIKFFFLILQPVLHYSFKLKIHKIMTNFTASEILSDDQLTDVKGGNGGKVIIIDIEGM